MKSKFLVLVLAVLLFLCTSTFATSIEDVYADENIYVSDKVIDLKQALIEHSDRSSLDTLTCKGISMMLPAIANDAYAKRTDYRYTEYGYSGCINGYTHEVEKSYRWYNDKFDWGYDTPGSIWQLGSFVTALSGRVDNSRTQLSANDIQKLNSTVTLLERRVLTRVVNSDYDLISRIWKSCGRCGGYYYNQYASKTLYTSRIENVTYKSIKSVTYTDCIFPFGLVEVYAPVSHLPSAYSPIIFAVPTKFIDCTFSEYLWIDCVGSGSVIFENCSYIGNRDLTFNSCSGTLDLSQWSGSSISGNGPS